MKSQHVVFELNGAWIVAHWDTERPEWLRVIGRFTDHTLARQYAAWRDAPKDGVTIAVGSYDTKVIGDRAIAVPAEPEPDLPVAEPDEPEPPEGPEPDGPESDEDEPDDPPWDREDLSPRQLQALEYFERLADKSELLPATATEACRNAGFPTGSLSQLISTLEERGFLTRLKNEATWAIELADGRVIRAVEAAGPQKGRRVGRPAQPMGDIPHPTDADDVPVDLANGDFEAVLDFLTEHGFEVKRTFQGYEMPDFADGVLTAKQVVQVANNERRRLDPPLPLYRIVEPPA